MSAVDGTIEPRTPDQQVEYWMDRYFALHDQYAEAVNALTAIAAIVNKPAKIGVGGVS